jgi:hypothetical protein
MTHGGRRAGAGRKKGSRSRKTHRVAEQAAREGISPLELLLKTMRSAWEKAAPDGSNIVSMPDAMIACALARDCAPYMHPRLALERHMNIGPNGEPVTLLRQEHIHIFLPDNGRDPDIVTVEQIQPPAAAPLTEMVLRPDPAHGRELREADVPVDATPMDFAPAESEEKSEN